MHPRGLSDDLKILRVMNIIVGKTVGTARLELATFGYADALTD